MQPRCARKRRTQFIIKSRPIPVLQQFCERRLDRRGHSSEIICSECPGQNQDEERRPNDCPPARIIRGNDGDQRDDPHAPGLSARNFICNTGVKIGKYILRNCRGVKLAHLPGKSLIGGYFPAAVCATGKMFLERAGLLGLQLGVGIKREQGFEFTTGVHVAITIVAFFVLHFCAPDEDCTTRCSPCMTAARRFRRRNTLQDRAK